MKKIIGIVAMALAATASQAWAQGYPNKPVHLIISFSPGSSTDIVGRIVLQKLSEIWGQPVIPENRSGAGGSIGTAVVAKAPADGYMLLIDSNAHTVTPSIYAKLPYEALNDFVDISPLALQPNVLIVNAGSQYKTLMDVVNAARAKPSAINWGHAGVGSGTHLNTEKFVAAAKINVTQIPFKGTPEVIQAMLSNSVDCYWAPISAAIPHIKGGRVRALAVSTREPSPFFPGLPTLDEAGLKGYDVTTWYGLLVPKATPVAVRTRLYQTVSEILKTPDMVARLADLGAVPGGAPPEKFAAFIQAETAKWTKVTREAGVTVE